MAKNKIRIEVEPIGKRLYLDRPANGLEALLEAGIGIKSVCGGKGTCGKCRIIVLDAADTAVSGQEKKVLSPEEISKGVRLACQQVFDRDLNIYIPASSLSEEQKLQVSGTGREVEPDPVCQKYWVEVSPATLEDVTPDFDRIAGLLEKNYKVKADNIDFKALSLLPQTLRDNGWKVTVSLRGTEIINVEGGNQAGHNYGVAIDLGTTKIAALLVDLSTGATLGSRGIMNPQISYGEDVMSRLNFALAGGDSLKKIQEVVTSGIDQAIGKLCQDHQIDRKQINEITLVANTAMHHLFLGLPVRQLSLSPFVSLTGQALSVKAWQLGINIAPGGYVYLLPPIAGFVGSDHLAMVLAADIDQLKGNIIGIDIGTNTEIALKTSSGITSVSTASGPAFEGAHIRYGMRAAPGAIERVAIDSATCQPSIQTIGDKEPSGICGSGILDCIAELRKANLIDTRGKFVQDSNCIFKDEQEGMQYLLSGKPGRDYVSIGQKDIVEIQLAKGAMRTGIDILLDNAQIDFTQIDKIIIAGAFGSYIDPKNVINIGMFPQVDLGKIVQVGNAAGVGAKQVLVSSKYRKKAENLAKKINYLELTTHPKFNEYFVNSLGFPEPEEIF